MRCLSWASSGSAGPLAAAATAAARSIRSFRFACPAVEGRTGAGAGAGAGLGAASRAQLSEDAVLFALGLGLGCCFGRVGLAVSSAVPAFVAAVRRAANQLRPDAGRLSFFAAVAGGLSFVPAAGWATGVLRCAHSLLLRAEALGTRLCCSALRRVASRASSTPRSTIACSRFSSCAADQLSSWVCHDDSVPSTAAAAASALGRGGATAAAAAAAPVFLGTGAASRSPWNLQKPACPGSRRQSQWRGHCTTAASAGAGAAGAGAPTSAALAPPASTAGARWRPLDCGPPFRRGGQRMFSSGPAPTAGRLGVTMVCPGAARLLVSTRGPRGGLERLRLRARFCRRPEPGREPGRAPGREPCSYTTAAERCLCAAGGDFAPDMASALAIAAGTAHPPRLAPGSVPAPAPPAASECLLTAIARRPASAPLAHALASPDAAAIEPRRCWRAAGSSERT